MPKEVKGVGDTWELFSSVTDPFYSSTPFTPVLAQILEPDAAVRSQLADDERLRWHAVDLYRSRKHTVKDICALLAIFRSTLYAYVEEVSRDGRPAGDGWPARRRMLGMSAWRAVEVSAPSA